ncbi:LytTR family transcriptional regulator [bacterium]|nr:LytTR family transcriptional regulator [bacterium]
MSEPTSAEHSTLQRYLRHRRGYEVLAWAGLFVFNAVANSLVSWMDLRRAELPAAAWEPVVWEVSSGLMLAALLPMVLWVDARTPLDVGNWRRALPVHLLATIPYSVLHVLGMVGLRELAYAAAGGNYDFGPWGPELFYEYLKDLRSWFTFLALIYLYRFVLRRLRGEARLLAEGEREAAAPVIDRFLVKKLGREFLVRTSDIDWLESGGNYVTLHCGSSDYLLRETMQNLEQRLAPQGFARVHRSAIVNLDRVAQITPFDTGDGELRLHSDARIPVSRRYRQRLRDQLSGS